MKFIRINKLDQNKSGGIMCDVSGNNDPTLYLTSGVLYIED